MKSLYTFKINPTCLNQFNCANKGIGCYNCIYYINEIKAFYQKKNYLVLNKGDKELLTKVFNLLSREHDIEIKDCSVYERINNDKWFCVLWDKLNENKTKKQKKLVTDWLKKGYGIICLPPRSGKTVIAMLLSYKLKTRTAIIVHNKDLLKQFYNTFYSFTNIKEKEVIEGKKLIKINPKEKELDSILVGLYTWQFFFKNYRKKIKNYRKKFGLIIVDECHKAASKEFSRVVNSFCSRYRCGLTATPYRRDGLHVKLFSIIGKPVVNYSFGELKTVFSFVDCSLHQEVNSEKYKNQNYFWQSFWKSIKSSPVIREKILQCVKEDLKNNRKIIIPVKFVEHAKQLAKQIKEKIKEDKTVTAYYGKINNREKVRKGIVDGKFDVVVATKNVISLGFNAPLMDTIYILYPNFDKNNFYQEFSRIRTKHPDKKNNPLIRIFLYNGKISNSFKGFCSKVFGEYKIVSIEENNKKGFYHGKFETF